MWQTIPHLILAAAVPASLPTITVTHDNDNVFAENSVTHGGDGFFGFAGREAIGEVWFQNERERWRRETGRTEVDELVRVPPELAARMSGLKHIPG